MHRVEASGRYLSGMGDSATPSTWARFPLHRVDPDGRCGCGDPSCPRAGKHPRVAWSQVAPGQVVDGDDGDGQGICTGTRSGIFVLDVDGPDAAKALVALGPVPQTYTVRTARGLHFYFKLPDFPVKTSGGALAKGLDIRGEGGYVVAAGSRHASGHVYTVADPSPVADAPAWLLTWEGLHGVASVAENSPLAIGPEHPDWARRLLLAEERCKTQEPNGGTANMWPLAQYLVRTLELPESTAVDLISRVYNPRCDPPWSDTEILHKVVSAREKGRRPTGPAPEGWAARLAAGPVEKLPKVSGDVPRRVTNEAHEYAHHTFDAPDSDPRKIHLNTAILTLCRNDEWAGVWQYDVFSQRVFAVNPPMPLDAEKGTLTPRDLAAIRTWFICQGGLLAKEDYWDACVLAAHEQEYNQFTEEYE